MIKQLTLFADYYQRIILLLFTWLLKNVDCDILGIQIFHMICLPNTQSAYLMGNDLCSFNQSTEPLIIVW